MVMQDQVLFKIIKDYIENNKRSISTLSKFGLFKSGVAETRANIGFADKLLNALNFIKFSPAVEREAQVVNIVCAFLSNPEVKGSPFETYLLNHHDGRTILSQLFKIPNDSAFETNLQGKISASNFNLGTADNLANLQSANQF